MGVVANIAGCCCEQVADCTPCDIPLADLAFELTWYGAFSPLCTVNSTSASGTLEYIGIVTVSSVNYHAWVACLEGEWGGDLNSDNDPECDAPLFIHMRCRVSTGATTFGHSIVATGNPEITDPTKPCGWGFNQFVNVTPSSSTCSPLDLDFVVTGGGGPGGKTSEVRIYEP